jgi:hypothetical protein
MTPTGSADGPGCPCTVSDRSLFDSFRGGSDSGASDYIQVGLSTLIGCLQHRSTHIITNRNPQTLPGGFGRDKKWFIVVRILRIIGITLNIDVNRSLSVEKLTLQTNVDCLVGSSFGDSDFFWLLALPDYTHNVRYDKMFTRNGWVHILLLLPSPFLFLIFCLLCTSYLFCLLLLGELYCEKCHLFF